VTFEPLLLFYLFYCTVFVSLILHTGDIDGAGLVTNSNVIEDDDFQGKPANSTSKELSDDDGDLEETTDPANANKMKSV